MATNTHVRARQLESVSPMATSWLPSLNPINSFPEYHGPYEVGTVDVEIPATDLPAPSKAPEDAQPTIAFRIFYPCVQPSSSEADRPVRWVPQPQRLTIAALMRFLGLRERAAGAMSYVTQQFYWIKLRAHRNAQLFDPPTSNGRWPVTFFSHGLGGQPECVQLRVWRSGEQRDDCYRVGPQGW